MTKITLPLTSSNGSRSIRLFCWLTLNGIAILSIFNIDHLSPLRSFKFAGHLLRSKYNRKFIEVDDFAFFDKASMP